MICRACGHAMADHMDRCVTGDRCAPPAGARVNSYQTTRCDCAGYVPSDEEGSAA